MIFSYLICFINVSSKANSSLPDGRVLKALTFWSLATILKTGVSSQMVCTCAC